MGCAPTGPAHDILGGEPWRPRTVDPRTIDNFPPSSIMAQTVFTFHCPCCNKLVEVDTRSGKARAARPEEAKGGRDLDTLLGDQGRDKKRLGDLFTSAKDQESRSADRLDEQLRRAKEEAKKDEDERPRNIFDLD